MTPTAQELWNDIKFCRKRFWEQYLEIESICKRFASKQITAERFNELKDSASIIAARFSKRIKELNESKTTG